MLPRSKTATAMKLTPYPKCRDSLTGDLAHMVVDGIVRILFRVGAISSILPVFMLPILLSIAIGILCGEMYTRTAVVLKRLSSSSHSPVFSQFSDTMAGLNVIRARGDMPKIFCNHLAKRFRPLSRTQEATFNLNRWVSVRIDFITAMVSVCAGIIAVARAKALGAGLVGFSLTNVAGLSSAILMLVRYLNDLEIEFQGVSTWQLHLDDILMDCELTHVYSFFESRST